MTSGYGANDNLSVVVTPLPTGKAITPTTLLTAGNYVASNDLGGVIITKPGTYAVTYIAQTGNADVVGGLTDDSDILPVTSRKFKIL